VNASPTKIWLRSFAVALLSVVLATALFWLIRRYLGKGHAALLYLPVVVFAASAGGTRAGHLAAALSFLAWNFFFLSPYGTFIIKDPKDWISLFVFLLVGTAMGVQTGRLQEREREALEREEEAALLYRLSAQMTSQTDTPALAKTLLEEALRLAGAQQTALFLPDRDDRLRIYAQAGAVPDDERVESLRSVADRSCREMKAVGLPAPDGALERIGEQWPISVPWDRFASDEDEIRGVLLPLQATQRSEGALYVGVAPENDPISPRVARFLVSLSYLAAAILERQRLQAEAAQSEALREADRLKSTFVSSVSHELKTPLSSISATVSNLLEGDVEWKPELLKEELSSIGDDLTRLNESIGHLVDLSRLEAGAWEPKRDRYEFGEILGTALSLFSSRDRRRISLAVPDDLPVLCVDFQQIARALQNLIENALLYSPAGVSVGAAALDGSLEIWVEDEGPGIPPPDRERIFEKFYRGSAAGTPSGTGLGLAIAREIVRYHGGRIRVEDRKPRGSRFVFSLPCPPDAKETVR
jgi:two-component system sensor histidine kinase KdpD